MPDRDDYIREFAKAAADIVSAQIAFSNAVIAARNAGISDPGACGDRWDAGAEIAQIPGGPVTALHDPARRVVALTSIPVAPHE